MNHDADRPLLDLLRRRGGLTVAEMCEHLGVTGNAVRTRLTRLEGLGLVEREAEHHGRGRPRHVYRATAKAHSQNGQNYAELAVVLWKQVMATRDEEARQLLLDRLAESLTQLYRGEVPGSTAPFIEKVEHLREVLKQRGIEAEVVQPDEAGLPVLELQSCPYHDLAQADPAICELEHATFERVLGSDLERTRCRLDGANCCDFAPKSSRPAV